MATVVVTWELGGGLGHLTRLLPLVRGLLDRGHRVVAAVRDLARVTRVYRDAAVTWLQAPVKLGRGPDAIEPPRTFAHILHNSGYGNPEELAAMVGAWRALFAAFRPGLIVFDHSPTALLASQGLSVRRALVSAGFLCPVNEYPLRDLRPWLPADGQRLRYEEDRVLEHANRVLRTLAAAPLSNLAELYDRVDEHFLATFAELDHYPGRTGATYWGAWPYIGGAPPSWPTGAGPRVFAYLKPFPELPTLLDRLSRSGSPTLIVPDGIDESLQQRYASPTLRFERESLDLRKVGQDCDVAVLNATHGTTVAMLLAGKPLLQIPIFLEQAHLAMAVERLGAGVAASPAKPDEVLAGVARLLSSSDYGEAARRFAQRYADYDPTAKINRMVDRAETLLRGD